MLTRRVNSRQGFADGALVLVEHRQLEGDADGALARDIVEGVGADPVAAPGVARVEVRLRPASGELALQRDRRQIVLAQRPDDFRARDERLAAPVVGRSGNERGGVRPPIPANRCPCSAEAGNPTAPASRASASSPRARARSSRCLARASSTSSASVSVRASSPAAACARRLSRSAWRSPIRASSSAASSRDEATSRSASRSEVRTCQIACARSDCAMAACAAA